MRLRAAAVLVLVLAAGCGAPAREAAPAEVPAAAVRAEARVVGTVVLSERVRDLTIDSPALGRTATVRLVLPTGFAARPERRWPVLYLLHGCCDSYASWTTRTDVEALTAGSDVLVVVPEGGSVGFYSDWLAGPGWERFHLGELPRLLAAGYRAGDARAIAGLSMGGLGALGYAARHPGMFRAAASFSGVVHTRLSGRDVDYRDLVISEGEDPERLWGDPVARADVWAAHNPYDLAGKLRGTRLFLSVGNGKPGPLDDPSGAADDTETTLAAENAALAGRLRSLGIPVTVDFYGPGTHTWPYWERELHRAWPLLRQALGSG